MSEQLFENRRIYMAQNRVWRYTLRLIHFGICHPLEFYGVVCLRVQLLDPWKMVLLVCKIVVYGVVFLLIYKFRGVGF